MAAQLYKTTSGRLFHAGQIAIITVGLPARGKTHVARSLCRYLRWLGVPTKVFSVGNYRRHVIGNASSLPHDFFNPGNLETAEARHKIATECLQDMIKWLQEGGQVGIYDASNTTQDRRKEVHDILISHNVHPLFIESICDKSEIIETNIRSVKITSPDYVGWDPEEAVKDYWTRINNHLEHYETIYDTELSFVKMINVGERIIVNNVKGYLQSRIMFYLMNLHISPRIIYFARSGESMNETSQKADAELSLAGKHYAYTLKNFLLALREREKKERKEQGWDDDERMLTIWTSARQRSYQTAKPFLDEGFNVYHRPSLAEINVGEVDNLTVEEIKAKFPEEYEKQQKDPYHYRYPRAESYQDLAVRIESIILELEYEKNDVLIIAHESVLRCLYAYLFDRPEDEIPRIVIPRNYLIEIIPSAYGCRETRMEIVDTFVHSVPLLADLSHNGKKSD
ncbi:bifunctional 6-phosphofructo-2-kinase/fructose-2,6-bisphosphate 2-phosphatase [Rhizophagus irregularis]|uniref:Bifunctional 6-phosphofructo-2-kinase/fructose-2,6-bisphosphate 2-phosphatase n=1 Tax=Rhizophagus irregularis TaxID=588596 RepID=A0A2I1G0X1_9GLOM|nr:bifunctional 6-phosphofructo-2-kinase/fructose-2,6-bisphosphate 2-phosphatase [Rhizophagus irregularis]